MKVSKKFFLAVPAALAIAVGAIAGTDSGKGGDWSAKRVERLQEELGLSADQTKSLEALFAAKKGERREHGKELHQAMKDFREAALDGKKSEVATKRAALLKAQGEMLDQQAEHLAKVGAILTPEQRTKFASMKRGGHHGRGHHRGHGHADDANTPNTPDSPAAED